MSDRVTDQHKKQKTIMISVFAASMILIIALIVFLAFLPGIKAEARMDDVRDALKSPEAISTVLLTDMSSINDALGAEGGEVILTSENEISEFSAELYSLAMASEFKGKSTVPFSAWDIRVRLYLDEDTLELLLSEEGIYLTVGNTRYNFVTYDKGYEKFYERVVSMLGNESDK